MIITRGRIDGPGSDRAGTTFTGQVWADPVLALTDGVLVNSVCFAPGARTHWHHHEGGQLLSVTSGEAWIGTRAGERAMLRAGDVAFFQPGEVHWHGAAAHTTMVHLAVSLGETSWLDAVTDEEYDAT